MTGTTIAGIAETAAKVQVNLARLTSLEIDNPLFTCMYLSSEKCMYVYIPAISTPISLSSQRSYGTEKCHITEQPTLKEQAYLYY